MSKKTITFELSESSIEKAIAKLVAYQKEIERKCDTLRKRVADRLKELSEEGFSGAIADDLTEQSGGAVTANVEVTVDHDDEGNVSVVIAHGEDAVWVEFGAGVHHNGSVGSYPNPLAQDAHMDAIGTYGKGRGSQDKWAFKENGEKKWTYGTPAKMPMYNAVQTVVSEIPQMFEEVFG